MSNKLRQYIMPFGYIAILLMILLAIWNPLIPTGSGPVDLLLLLDESDSIKTQHNNTVWHSFLQQSESLPAGSRISLMRFADRSAIEIPWTKVNEAGFFQLKKSQAMPRHRYLDSGASSLTSAVESAIKYSSPDRHSAILISSDGNDNVAATQTVSALTNNTPGLSLFYLEADNRFHTSALSIESVNLPYASVAGHSLPLSIAFKSHIGGQGNLTVLLNEHVTEQQHLVLKSGELKVINLKLIADKNQRQTIEIIVRDKHDNILDQQKHVVTNRIDKKLLYIGHNSFDAYSHYLKQEGWQVVQIQPHELTTEEAFFNNFNVVLMDNLKADELTGNITRNLITAVQQTGTGLIVLGGPDSFGSGNYRHSELEKILPVTAEASRPLPAAAFLFLLDKSGSMDTAGRKSSRLSDALRAVSESAKSLRPGDESALLVFDKSVDVLLPLIPRADSAAALNQSWSLQASGGTQLRPALEQAIKQLSQSVSKQRFLIIVTDGFVDSEHIQAMKPLIQQSGIQLIALAVGNNADIAKLQELASINNGHVLRVNTSAELPRLMRQELETRQHSWNNQPVTPVTVNQPPFLSQQANNWHSISGYQLTRARSSASVYVTTNKGDPLLAMQHSGAGRVAALPGGILNSISPESLLNQLTSWLNSHQQNHNLNITHHYLSGKLRLYVDATDFDKHWHPATTAEMMLTDPHGNNQHHLLQAIAPGRFTTIVDAPVSGIYRAKITIAEQQTVYTTYLVSNRERREHQTAPWLKQALSTKNIRHWKQSNINELLQESTGQLATRLAWLFLALCSFLALIAFERSAGLQTYINKHSELKLTAGFRGKHHE